MSKTEPTESIKKFRIGEKDQSGYEIVDILATGNEYVIYEIKHKDINNRLKVFIDGHTDESENTLSQKFAAIKQKYIQAKGLLYRSSNFGMMKNRVAHALATALVSNNTDNESDFEKLIEQIENEANQVILNRLLYILPTTLLTILFSVCVYFKMDIKTSDYQTWQVLMIMLASSLGGTLSILIGTKRLHFEEFSNKWFYLQLGIERFLLAEVAGMVAYILIRSKFFFPQILENDHWKIMSVIVLSAFSESVIPSVLGKMEKRS